MTIKRGRPSATESRKKIKHILSVAQQEFSEHGYSAVTMRDVADKARVSTRTLYNHYDDKLSLFSACIDSGAAADFPRINPDSGRTVEEVLRNHTVAVVNNLSQNMSLRLITLLHREGVEFPELLQTAQRSEYQVMIKPVAGYLSDAGLAGRDAEERAKLFWSLALREWLYRMLFQLPQPGPGEVKRQAEIAVDLFLHGVMGRPANEQVR